MKISIDTKIFITVMNKEKNSEYCEEILNAIEAGKLKCLISTIVIAEVLVGYYQNKQEKEAEKFYIKSLQMYDIIPVDLEISLKSARIRGLHKIKLPDAIVIATAAINDSDYLITNDGNLDKTKEISIFTAKDFTDRFLTSDQSKRGTE